MNCPQNLVTRYPSCICSDISKNANMLIAFLFADTFNTLLHWCLQYGVKNEQQKKKTKTKQKHQSTSATMDLFL